MILKKNFTPIFSHKLIFSKVNMIKLDLAMTSMKPIQQVRVPAGSDLVFAPGGKHVMLFDVNPGIKPGSPVPLLFTFADGQRITYKATAVGAGDGAPGS